MVKVIAPTLTRIFLHSIQMEIPDDDKRSAMLQWLLRKHGLETNADVSYLVTQTSGYLYADFIVLLSLAARYVKLTYIFYIKKTKSSLKS